MSEQYTVLPPVWCGQICRNAMNDQCIESCAVKRDCSAFVPKPQMRLVDMPRFPDTSAMTREEKFTSVAFYLAKVIEHLQGVKDEYIPVYHRPHLHRSRSSALPENLQGKALLPDCPKEVSPPENQQECESQGVGSAEVDRAANLLRTTNFLAEQEEIDDSI